MSEILSIGTWRTNAEMIAAIAPLGYLDGIVLDVTYGEAGGFWKDWQPDILHTNDLYAPADTHWDYRALPPIADLMADTVVFDPPYKLNGTPALGEQDVRYGTSGKTSRQEVLDDIVAGALECYRVTRRFLLVKCMDQVEGGRMRWQTDLVTQAIEGLCLCGHGDYDHHGGTLDDPHVPRCVVCDCTEFVGGRKMDRFDIPTAGIPQAATGRVQRTSRAKHSTLLVFEKPRGRRSNQAQGAML